MKSCRGSKRGFAALFPFSLFFYLSGVERGPFLLLLLLFPIIIQIYPHSTTHSERTPGYNSTGCSYCVIYEGRVAKKSFACIFNLWGTKLIPLSPLEQIDVEEHVLPLVHHPHGLGGEEDVPDLPRGGAEDHDWGEKDKK